MEINIIKGKNKISHIDQFKNKVNKSIESTYKVLPEKIIISVNKKEEWLRISGNAVFNEITDEISGNFLWLPNLNIYRGSIESSYKIAKSYFEDWNKLGFFYTENKENKTIRIIGTRMGILKFCEYLEFKYNNITRFEMGEHDHIGPYMHLVFYYEDYCRIDNLSITGDKEGFWRLSDIIKRSLNKNSNDSINIDEEYSPDNSYSLNIEIMEDGFLPGSLDHDYIKYWKKEADKIL